jgi:hypothetical protein
MMNPEIQKSPFCVIEGPSRGDAEFYAKWLAAVADAEMLWQKALRQRKFSKQVIRLSAVYIPNFGISAAIFLGELWKNGIAAALDLWGDDDSGAIEFVIMVKLGFFRRTGMRYRMTVPDDLDIAAIKAAALVLARTEDRNYCLHPEALVTHMSKDNAQACRRRLRDVNQDRRIREQPRKPFDYTV